MPPKGSKKIKENQKVSLEQEVIFNAQSLVPNSRYKFLRMYSSFDCKTNQPGFFNANYAYLRKIGANQKHRIDRYYLKLERNTIWEDKLLIFKHLEKYKRLRKISFYIGQKIINQGTRLQQQIEILRRFRSSLKRFPRLSKIEFIYPNKLIDLIFLRKAIGHLDHLTLGLDINDFLKDENETKLMAFMKKHFQYHRVKSVKLICYGASGSSKKGKKGGKGKPKKGKRNEEEFRPVDLLKPKFNHFTQIESLSLECKETKIYTAFKNLLLNETFPYLKSLSIQTPEGGFTIKNDSGAIIGSIISLIEILDIKTTHAKKKIVDQKSLGNEISLKNYESILKTKMKDFISLGNVRKLVIEIAKSKEGEIKNIFNNVPNLKELYFQYSPQSDEQVKEFYEGLKNVNRLKDLELYFQNYTFSKDSIKGIFEAISKHAPYLSKFCFGGNEVDHINDTGLIMSHVLKMPNLSILRLYLGYVGNYKKTLNPLEQIKQIKKLTEFEFGGFFNSQSVRGIGEFFRDILFYMNTLRSLSLKVVWHYNVWDGFARKEDFTSALGEVPILTKLQELFVDFENSTWHRVKPK